MKISEILTEAYNQSLADAALNKGMLEIVQYLRTSNVIDYLNRELNWRGHAYNKMRSTVFAALYRTYLRKNFQSADTKYVMDDKSYEKVILQLMRSTPPNMAAESTSDGFVHWQLKNKNEFNSDKTRKGYLTINPSTTPEQLTNSLKQLIAYVGSPRSLVYEFKVPTNNISTEMDSVVVYFKKDLDQYTISQEYNKLKAWFNTITRVHRNDLGIDDKKFKNPYKMNLAGGTNESDSSIRLYKFADYLCDNVATLQTYLKQYDDAMMAKILAKTWKDKFERKTFY